MKTLEKQTRALSEKETKALKKIRSTIKKELDKGYRLRHYVLAFTLGILFSYFAYLTAYDLLLFLFGVVAIFSFAFLVFAPYERYKDQRKFKSELARVEQILTRQTVDVYPVTAKRMAVAKEYEDESDLYVAELDSKQILYLWDTEHNLKKSLPCLQFELYDEDFSKVYGRDVNPLSEKMKGIIIDPAAKWAFMEKWSPEHRQIVNKDFDKLLKDVERAGELAEKKPRKKKK